MKYSYPNFGSRIKARGELDSLPLDEDQTGEKASSTPRPGVTLNGALKFDDAFKSDDEVDDTFWPCCAHDGVSVRPQLLDACGTGGS